MRGFCRRPSFRAAFQCHVTLSILLVFSLRGTSAARLRATFAPGLRLHAAQQQQCDLLSPLSSVKQFPEAPHINISQQLDLRNPYVATVFSPCNATKLPQLASSSKVHDTQLAFDLTTAYRAARLVSISYCVDSDEILQWNCTRCSAAAGVQPYAVVYDEIWDVMGYVAYDSELAAITVVFRGTDSSNMWNWFEDLRYWKTNYMVDIPEAQGAKIHTGFWLLWSESIMEMNITDMFTAARAKHPGAPVYVIGHSMGGALAQLCAVHLRVQLNEPDIRLFTFGSPRVGNDVFAALITQSVTESWRFTHNRDLVPSVPFQILGFRHPAQEVWLVDVEDQQTQQVDEKIIICDGGPDEDPTCHNSVCHLGICTSIADHLVYLGIHMYRDELEC